MNSKQELLKLLEQDFQKADKEGLWFFFESFFGYQSWVTPRELVVLIDALYILGFQARNQVAKYSLRDPREALEVLRYRLDAAQAEYDAFEARLKKEQETP